MRGGDGQPLSDRFEQGIRESARRSRKASRARGDTGPTAPRDAGPAGLEGAHQFDILAAREVIKAACAPIGCRRNSQVGTVHMPMGINIDIGLREVRTQQVGMLIVGGPVLNPYGPTHRVCLQREHGRGIGTGVRHDHQLDGFGDESNVSGSLKNAVDAFHEDVLFSVCRNHDADHVLVGMSEASGRISPRSDPLVSEQDVNLRRPPTPGSMRSRMWATSSRRIQPLAGLRGSAHVVHFAIDSPIRSGPVQALEKALQCPPTRFIAAIPQRGCLARAF